MRQEITIQKAFRVCASICFFLLGSCYPKFGGDAEIEDHPKYLEQISYLNVKITDNFWGPKIKMNGEKGIPSVFEAGKTSLENFGIAAKIIEGEHNQRMASDSDVYKIIQGVAYSLHHSSDKELEEFTDNLIDWIVAAQEDDGYLFTYWSAIDPARRWTNIKKDHELYCAGHLFEAAIAYYEVTGKRKLLDAAIKLADHIDSIFGPGKRIEVPGHQEIELALFKLYQTTGNKKYLNLSEFFLNERGNSERIDTIPPNFDPNAGTPHRWRHPSYRQDHLPVHKQFQATGHAVRAVYMYAAMADLTKESGDEKYLPALDAIWKDITDTKLYVTGGIGTHEFHDEGFGLPYKLPNHSAYCESCSGMGLCFWNRRMNLLKADGKYADLVELLMYNAAISSVNLEGDHFFYKNPLESEGNYSRKPWFNPACCPSNMVRFLPEIGSTLYATSDREIYVNQYVGNEAEIRQDNLNVDLKMETDYPWDGEIILRVNPAEAKTFKVFIRIPSWVRGQFLVGSNLYKISENGNPTDDLVAIKVNGKKIDNSRVIKGYVEIDRKWKSGDLIEINFPMVPRKVTGHPNIEATKDKFTVMRGPVIYCLEEADNELFFRQEYQSKVDSDELTDAYEE
jgi:uncharacterized protein